MRRLAAVVAISLAGFVAALLSFSGQAPRACVADAPEDPAYTAKLASPVRIGEQAHTLEVRRRGRPATGAHVCLRAELADRPGTRVDVRADEVGRGRYEVRVGFPRTGEWRGVVLIGPDPTTVEASVPVSFEVTR